MTTLQSITKVAEARNAPVCRIPATCFSWRLMRPLFHLLTVHDVLSKCRCGAVAGAIAVSGSAQAAMGVGEGGVDPEPAVTAQTQVSVHVLRFEFSDRLGSRSQGVVLLAQAQMPPPPRASRSDFGPPRTPAEGLPLVRDERREWLRRGRELRSDDGEGERVHMSREERRALRAAIRDAGHRLYTPPAQDALPESAQPPSR